MTREEQNETEHTPTALHLYGEIVTTELLLARMIATLAKEAGVTRFNFEEIERKIHEIVLEPSSGLSTRERGEVANGVFFAMARVRTSVEATLGIGDNQPKPSQGDS